MIEQGLVLFLQSGLAGSPPVATVPGGYAVQFPKDLITAAVPMAWCYRFITSEPLYFLDGQDGLTVATVQIDCHGYTMANAFTMARAIEKLLRGPFKTTFADPDATFVDSIFREPPFVDGFSDINRSFVRSLEYVIHYRQI